jgi:hypothetical protein
VAESQSQRIRFLEHTIDELQRRADQTERTYAMEKKALEDRVNDLERARDMVIGASWPMRIFMKIVFAVFTGGGIDVIYRVVHFFLHPMATQVAK